MFVITAKLKVESMVSTKIVFDWRSESEYEAFQEATGRIDYVPFFPSVGLPYVWCRCNVILIADQNPLSYELKSYSRYVTTTF